MGGRDPSALVPRYTARALVEVLPYGETNPMTIGTPVVDKDTQYRFRRSMAALVKWEHTLEELVHKEAIRKTNWLKRQGPEGHYETRQRAVADLKKNLQVRTEENVNFIEISMTCNDLDCAMLIVKEAVELFLNLQRYRKQGEIVERLHSLEKRMELVMQEWDAAERALEVVRTGYGFTDLEVHTYPHPVILRLNQLQRARDTLVVEIRGVKAKQENLKGNQDEKKGLELKLVMLQGKLAELEKLLEEATAKNRELGRARVQYERRAAIRDERRRTYDEIKLLAEKLRIMVDDPTIAKLRLVGHITVGPEPQESRGSERK
jgi:hypothetical protein